MIEEYDPNKQTFSGMGPGVGGALGVTNDTSNPINSQLQSIIDKVSGSFSGVSRGRVAQLQAGLGEKAMGIAGGLEQEKLQQAGAMERERFGIQKTEIATKPSMMEQERKERMRMAPGASFSLGLGIGNTGQNPQKPTTLLDLHDAWVKNQKV